MHWPCFSIVICLWTRQNLLVQRRNYLFDSRKLLWPLVLNLFWRLINDNLRRRHPWWNHRARNIQRRDTNCCVTSFLAACCLVALFRYGLYQVLVWGSTDIIHSNLWYRKICTVLAWCSSQFRKLTMGVNSLHYLICLFKTLWSFFQHLVKLIQLISKIVHISWKRSLIFCHRYVVILTSLYVKLIL